MNQRILRAILVAMTCILVACCATVYQAPNFQNLAQTHKITAILPPSVVINAESFKAGTPVATIAAQCKEEADAFHRTLYIQFLAQQSKNKYTVVFQDIDETMLLLERAGLTQEKLRGSTRAEIAKALGVDSVIVTRVYRDKPMSAGAAIAALFLVGASGSTNEVQVNLSVYDGKTGQLVWNYDHLIGGGLISSADGMTRSLMKSISKKFPYRRPKS